MYANGIGTVVADLYIAWSYYFDATDNFQQAEAVFRKGLDAKAQPFDELAQAHQAFSISMAQRILYKDDSSQEQFRATMEEKRSALTTLRAHNKKYVGSVRTGIAVRHENPGIVDQENAPAGMNTKVEVHEEAAASAALHLPSETSVIRSIIDSARKKENAHEPGPWTKGKLGKTGKLFGKEDVKMPLDFNIMEDDNLPPIPCPEKLFEKGIQLPPNFVARNEPQPSFDIPMVVAEPAVPRAVPCYEKFLLYPNQTTEISPDEYRGYKWYKDHGMTTRLTKQYDSIWANTFESGIRIPPGFVNRNMPQIEHQKIERFVATDEIQSFVFPIDWIYPGENDGEISFEELLAEKYKRGDIILMKEEDFEESDDMDLTQIGDRRQSFYPTSGASFFPRKSIAVRKSMMPPAIEADEAAELEPVQPLVVVKSTGAVRKSILKRKLDSNDYKPTSDDYNSFPKKDFVAETPPRSSFSSVLFKPPAPVDKKPATVGFSMDEGDVTVSTQQFNFFLKSQLVSTPVSKKKPSALVPVEEAASQEVEALPSPPSPEIYPTSQVPISDAAPKQLSIIMETTEPTHSTKSSVSQASAGNDTDLNSKTSKASYLHKSYQSPKNQEKVKQLFDPLMVTLTLPEEQTQNCTNYVQPKFQQINCSTEMKNCEIKFPETQNTKIIQNCSIAAPPAHFDVTIKSPSAGSSTKAQLDKKTGDMPAVQSFALNNAKSLAQITEEAQIPATQTSVTKFQTGKPYESILEHSTLLSATLVKQIPDTHVNESVFEVQETQFESSLGEIPETQPDRMLEAEASHGIKHNPIPFNIYEDSVFDPTQQKLPVVKQNDDRPADLLQASFDENQGVLLAAVGRSISDEFLEVLSSPKKSCFARKSNEFAQDNISDFLKFSNASHISLAVAELEVPMERFSIQERKIPSPVDTDLNTQNFAAVLGGTKNSTLISDKFANIHPTTMLDNLRVSFEMEEDEIIKMATVVKSDEKIPDVSLTDEDMERLGLARKETKVERVEFKIPSLPALKIAASKIPALKPAAAKPQNMFDILEDSGDDSNDLSKSIYKQQEEPEEEYEGDWDEGSSFISTPCNQYEHTIVNAELSFKVKEAILNSNGNPFERPLRDTMLEHCNFSFWLSNNVGTCELLKKIPPLRKGSTIVVGNNQFSVNKLIAKGSFGMIYSGRNIKTGEIVAMKQEKPPCLWEYYISVELRDRLKDKRMLSAFMSIDHAVIAHNASILLSKFSSYGSIISVCNKHKTATNKNIDEYVVMVLTTQLLSIMDHLHSCNIIHADVKPDNFLLMSK